jgi:putative membrane protein
MSDVAPVQFDHGTQLALERTRLAHERTMMAWVRTSVSLISFGFTIYKFFEFDIKRTAHVERLIGPRGFALIMISIGLFALAVSGLQYRRDLQSLTEKFGIEQPHSVAGLVAGLIGLLGVFALTLVIIRA